MAKLLVRPRPYRDESFMGYMVRLSEVNGYDSPHEIFHLAGGYRVYIGEEGVFVARRSSMLGGLSRLIGLKKEEIDSMVAQPTDPKDKGLMQPYLIFGQRVPKYLIRFSETKICPDCLRESGYIRRMWYLAAVTACPVHNRLLLDECPSCKKPIRWKRAKVCVCSCGYDLREASSTELDGEETKLSDQIYRLCGLKTEEKSAREQLAATNPLYKLDLQHLLTIVFFVAGQLHGVTDTKGKTLAPSLKNGKLHELLTKAFSLFENWPVQYQQFLTDLIKQNDKDDGHTGLFKDFGNFYKRLYHTLKDPQFDFMRSAFEEFLIDEWNGGYCSNLRTAPTRSRKYEIGKEAARLLNVCQPTVPRLVKKGMLDGFVRKMGSKELCLVNVESIHRLKKRYDKALTLKETGKKLGISGRHVANLAKSGCLEALRGATSDGCAIWKFEREAIDKLVNRAIHMLSLLSLKLEYFVKAILERKIRPCGIGSKQGFAGLLFPKKEIRDYLNDGLTIKRKGMLSVRKAANVLGVKSCVLYALIKKNFIEVDREILYGAEQTVRVGQEEIEKFKATHTFSNHIARTYNISPHHLLFLIMDQGIMPVSGPLIDGGWQYVFKTSDIQSLDIAKLISEEKAAKSGDMRESKLLTTEQAAKHVCLMKKEILKFIKSGALNPSFPPKSKRRKGTRLYFTLFNVERFKERYIDAPGVLSAGEAAKMLGEDLSWFYKKWVKTGRLKTVNFKDKLGKHYFRQEDVEAAKRLKVSTMTGPEAAKILGVHRNIVTKWRNKDKLRAISGPGIDGFGCHLYLRNDIRRMKRKRALHYAGQQELVFEA